MIKQFTVKKLGFSFCAMLIMATMVSLVAKGQFPASDYTFTQTSGTYTPITGGTLVASSVPDNVTYPVALTQGFNFCGTVYTNAFVGDNGVISLGGTTAANFTSAILNGGGSGILLCPFNSNLIGSSAAGATPNIRYQLVGNEHVFQWTDVSRSPGTTDRFSFQARLNYVTGTITYVYSVTSVGTSTGNQPVIGIRTDNTAGNWQSRLVANDATSSWAASVPGTATTNSCRFTSSATNPKQPANGQTYIYTPPPPCNTITGLPTAGTTNATPGVVCVSQNVTLSFTPATAMPVTTGITYQWQSAPAAGGPWTNMGTPTTATTYTTATPVSTPLFFRAQVLCNGTTVLFNSAPTQVVVSNPGTPTVTNGTRCGPGVVDLNATTAATNGSIRWFSNLTSAVPLATTNTFTTPYLAQSTTYYAAAVTNATFQTYNAGLPAFIQNFQVIGVVPGVGLNFTITNTCNIDSVGVYPVGTGTLSIAIWNATTQALVYTSPTSPVITGTGVEKRMIPVGATGLPPGDYIIGLAAFTGLTNLRNEGASPVAYPFTCPVLSITSGSVGFGSPIPNLYLYCYDWKVSTIGGCEGPRVPVTATVTTPPAISKSAPAVACNNAITQITIISSPMSNYTTYAWTPVVTDLYANAAATVPYTTGSAPLVWMKSSTVGEHIYYLYASGATPAACAFADTIKIWVQPDSVYIKAAPDTICVSGTSTLKLIPQTGYAPNTIQWQESPDGTTYTDILGATSVVYTTPTLTADHYYRALINTVGSVPPCLSPVKKIVVANPQLISKTDSFNCGPGTVTLQATIGANSSVKWYESMIASQPVGAGSPWVTPFLNVTDTFYVAASSGTLQPDPANVVVAGSTGTMASYRLPLFYNKGHRFQWMITAAEMTAQGYTEGLVKSIGFDFAGVNMTYQNISLKMKLTTASSFAVGGAPGTTFTTGMAQVYTAASFTPTPNSINSFMLQAPFYWDGTSNIIIEMCHSNPTTGTLANSANLKYRYYDTYPNNLAIYQYGNVDNICSTPTGGTTTGPVSSYYRPHTIIGMAGPCESPRQAVIAHIRPVPVVDLGADINKCVDAGYEEILDAGVQPNTPQFLWDNGSVNQTRAVSASGTYTVKVTNEYTCHGEDTINVILRPNPVVDLGNDTIVCNGVTLTLDPGNVGAQYSWNTGQTTQSITTSVPGTFSVLVTSSQGCKKSDDIVVSMVGQLPTTQGINVTNDGQYTVHFAVINPLNVTGYDWDFGDGSPHSNEASPTHTYPSDGDYIVVLRLSSSCGFVDEVLSAHILGINQLNVNRDELLVYPNPTKDAATILNRGGLKMENITVYNILGQVIYKSKADSKDKHTLNLGGFASGVYTIQIYTDKGTVARKLEIIK
jgi:hypothetical protein